MLGILACGVICCILMHVLCVTLPTLGTRYTNCRNDIQWFCIETVLERRGQRSRATFSSKPVLRYGDHETITVSVDASTQMCVVATG